MAKLSKTMIKKIQTKNRAIVSDLSKKGYNNIGVTSTGRTTYSVTKKRALKRLKIGKNKHSKKIEDAKLVKVTIPTGKHAGRKVYVFVAKLKKRKKK